MGTCAKLSGVLRLPPEHILFGRSEAMAVLRVQLQRVAANHLPVLIHGESGTGKEILVRLIHAWSPWGSGPLLKVNCSALGAGMADELFGPDRSAIGDAFADGSTGTPTAPQGTLFLDEVTETDLALQARLTYALQEGPLCRIGLEDKCLETRLLCTTSRPWGTR